MTSAVVTDPGKLRRDLLDRVDSVRDILASTAAESAAARRLVPEAAAAIEDAGLFRMRAPEEVGGMGTPPAIQMEILAAITEIDASAGWVTMIINNGCGWMGAFLPDENVAELFGDGKFPLVAGIAEPSGTAVAEDGGYRITGYRGRFCSGVDHASWLRLTVRVDGDPARPAIIIVPKSAVTVHDTWHVLGLRGTGSADVSVDDYLLPAHRLLFEVERRRGGPHLRQQGLIASSFEHAGIALGIGRRALKEFAIMVALKSRTKGVPPREVVLDALGRRTIALEAAAALAIRTFERSYELLSDDDVDASQVGLDGPVVASLITEAAVECAESAYRYAGTAALYLPNPFEQLLRDIHAATQHVQVQDVNYAALGARRLPNDQEGA